MSSSSIRQVFFEIPGPIHQHHRHRASQDFRAYLIGVLLDFQSRSATFDPDALHVLGQQLASVSGFQFCFTRHAERSRLPLFPASGPTDKSGINVRLPLDLSDWLTAYSREHGLSVSLLLTVALEHCKDRQVDPLVALGSRHSGRKSVAPLPSAPPSLDPAASAFFSAMSDWIATHERRRIRDYQRTAVSKDAGHRCQICGVDCTVSGTIQPIVPLGMFGRSIADNFLLSCQSCARQRGNRDLLTVGIHADFKSSLLLRRRQLIEHVPHHLVRSSGSAALRILKARFDKPRRRLFCYEDARLGTWLAWTDGCAWSESAFWLEAAIRMGLRGQSLLKSRGASLFYVAPGVDCEPVLWDAIDDEHAVVVRAIPSPAAGVEWSPKRTFSHKRDWGVLTNRRSVLVGTARQTVTSGDQQGTASGPADSPGFP